MKEIKPAKRNFNPCTGYAPFDVHNCPACGSNRVIVIDIDGNESEVYCKACQADLDVSVKPKL